MACFNMGSRKGKVLSFLIISHLNTAFLYLDIVSSSFILHEIEWLTKRAEVSWNPYSSICWKFQLSISLGRKKSPSTIQSGLNLSKPFWMYSAKPSFWILECCEQLCSVPLKQTSFWYMILARIIVAGTVICLITGSVLWILQGKGGLENL